MFDGYTMDVLEQRIGYCFHNKALLKQALTHSSYTNEQKINKTENYERIEFLGDAVLELVSSDFLFREHPDVPEGELTKMRASMVCEPSLAFCARDLELGQFMLLGKGEENTGGRRRDSITSDGMEAMIGAIYLDGGFANAKEFVLKYILTDIEHKQLFYDSKTILQEIVQGHTDETLTYVLLKEEGPDHNKSFEVSAMLDGQEIGRGIGRTKKSAEQRAAYRGILTIRKPQE